MDRQPAVSDYWRIAVRGWAMVTLVSSNSVFLAHQQITLATVGGFAISALWWANSSSKRPDAPWGWLVYGLGAASGTWTGATLAYWLGRMF